MAGRRCPHTSDAGRQKRGRGDGGAAGLSSAWHQHPFSGRSWLDSVVVRLWPALSPTRPAGVQGVSKSCGAVDWGRRKRPVSRWLTAGSQPAPPRQRQPTGQSCCCAFCPRGVLGIFAIAVRRLASGRLFSLPARPTSPDNPSCPFPVRAVWTFFVALGRLRACEELLFARGVSGRSLQISNL